MKRYKEEFCFVNLMQRVAHPSSVLSRAEDSSPSCATVALSPPVFLLSCGHAHKRRIKELLGKELAGTILPMTNDTAEREGGRWGKWATTFNQKSGNSSHQLIPFVFDAPPKEREAAVNRLVSDWRLWGGSRCAHNFYCVDVVVRSWARHVLGHWS